MENGSPFTKVYLRHRQKLHWRPAWYNYLASLNRSLPNKKSHFRYVWKTRKVYHDAEKMRLPLKD